MVETVNRQSTELALEIDKGSTFRHTVTWKSGPTGSETLVDLTGATARMQIRSDVTNDTILHEMTTENDGITLGGALGTIELHISDTDSTLFAWTKGVYGLEIILSTGDVRRLLRGKVKAFDETTR